MMLNIYMSFLPGSAIMVNCLAILTMATSWALMWVVDEEAEVEFGHS